MKTAVMYNSDGMITGIRSGSPRGVLIDAEASGQSYLLTEADVDIDRFYVNIETSEIVEYPEKPSAAHVFNFASCVWELDLSEARAIAWDRIKRHRSSEEFGTFIWNDYTFDCNEVSQRRIQGAVQLAVLDTNSVIVWTLADNTAQTFNAAEIKQIGQALANHVNTCHERGRILRQQIQAATTQEELEAIAW
jgi:hypothetical protein